MEMSSDSFMHLRPNTPPCFLLSSAQFSKSCESKLWDAWDIAKPDLIIQDHWLDPVLTNNPWRKNNGEKEVSHFFIKKYLLQLLTLE